MEPNAAGRQQYCLKWNNHKTNISGVFDRLRTNEKFTDVTLSSADKKSIKCHRILLSAGSGYLEKILDQNPSDHPTVVLSQINYTELKHLVEFMYSGEVAVEQEYLSKLLEAANILQIKGLYESPDDTPNLPPSVDDKPLEDEKEETSSSTALTGSQKRKKRKSESVENKAVKKVKNEESITPPDSPNVYSPLFGISNAYFLNQQPIPNASANAGNSPLKPAIKDIPNLLSQHPLPLNPSLLQDFKSNDLKLDQIGLLSNAPVRRYKQYTEDTLQQALKEIMGGQSINRSSMKYNIPARTLRDWMKRLNIKSVFTHHSQKDGRSLSADSSDYNSEESQAQDQPGTTEDKVMFKIKSYFLRLPFVAFSATKIS